MIDRAIILNLPKRTDRKHQMTGMLKALGWPIQKITFWQARDGRHYSDKTREGDKARSPQTANVALAAIGDGFEFFKYMFPEMDGQQEHDGLWIGKHLDADLQTTAQFWNFCRIYRHIASKNQICMVCHDDAAPKVPYLELCDMLSELNVENDFKLLLYHWNFDEWMCHGSPQPTCEPTHVPDVVKGLLGCGDKISIISPKGAEWLLEMMEKFIYRNCPSSEGIYSMCLKGEAPIPEGVYSLKGHIRSDRSGDRKIGGLMGDMTDETFSDIWIYPDDGKDPILPIEETNDHPEVDWDYYLQALPKLKAKYAELANR